MPLKALITNNTRYITSNEIAKIIKRDKSSMKFEGQCRGLFKITIPEFITKNLSGQSVTALILPRSYKSLVKTEKLLLECPQIMPRNLIKTDNARNSSRSDHYIKKEREILNRQKEVTDSQMSPSISSVQYIIGHVLRILH